MEENGQLIREGYWAPLLSDRWRRTMPSIAKKYKTDVHAASNIRVNGNAYQMDELYDVFNITDGYFYVKKENRIHIW